MKKQRYGTTDRNKTGWLGNLTKSLLAVLGCAGFSLGIYEVYMGKLAEAGTAFGGGALIMIFAFLSQFKRFKGFGIEAETWEQTMEEAKDIIQQLKKLSIVISEPLLSIAGRMGRLDTAFTRQERYDVRRKVEALLAGIDFSEEEIERVTAEIKKFDYYDMGHDICTKVREYFKGIDPNKQKYQANDIQGLNDYVMGNVRSLPEDFPNQLSSSKFLSAQDTSAILARVDAELKRISCFRKTGEIMNKDEWLKGRSR